MKTRFTLESKMYIFVASVVIFAAFGVAMLSYIITSGQMERFDKRITLDSAKNYVSLTDVGYLKKLKDVVLSDEYMTLRDQAEKDDNEGTGDEALFQCTKPSGVPRGPSHLQFP